MAIDKAKPRTSWDTSTHEDDRPSIGGFYVTKLVREHVPVKGGGTSTMGQLLDAYLSECAVNGSEVQSIELTFLDEQWPMYAQGTLRGSA